MNNVGLEELQSVSRILAELLFHNLQHHSRCISCRELRRVDPHFRMKRRFVGVLEPWNGRRLTTLTSLIGPFVVTMHRES